MRCAATVGVRGSRAVLGPSRPTVRTARTPTPPRTHRRGTTKRLRGRELVNFAAHPKFLHGKIRDLTMTSRVAARPLCAAVDAVAATRARAGSRGKARDAPRGGRGRRGARAAAAGTGARRRARGATIGRLRSLSEVDVVTSAVAAHARLRRRAALAEGRLHFRRAARHGGGCEPRAPATRQPIALTSCRLGHGARHGGPPPSCWDDARPADGGRIGAGRRARAAARALAARCSGGGGGGDALRRGDGGRGVPRLMTPLSASADDETAAARAVARAGILVRGGGRRPAARRRTTADAAFGADTGRGGGGAARGAGARARLARPRTRCTRADVLAPCRPRGWAPPPARTRAARSRTCSCSPGLLSPSTLRATGARSRARAAGAMERQRLILLSAGFKPKRPAKDRARMRARQACGSLDWRRTREGRPPGAEARRAAKAGSTPAPSRGGRGRAPAATRRRRQETTRTTPKNANGVGLAAVRHKPVARGCGMSIAAPRRAFGSAAGPLAVPGRNRRGCTARPPRAARSGAAADDRRDPPAITERPREVESIRVFLVIVGVQGGDRGGTRDEAVDSGLAPERPAPLPTRAPPAAPSPTWQGRRPARLGSKSDRRSACGRRPASTRSGAGARVQLVCRDPRGRRQRKERESARASAASKMARKPRAPRRTAARRERAPAAAVRRATQRASTCSMRAATRRAGLAPPPGASASSASRTRARSA